MYRHPAAGNKRIVRVLPLGFAVVEFEKERKTRCNAKIGFAKDDKMTDV